MKPQKKRALPVQEAANYLGYEKSTLRDLRWRKKAGVPATRIGGKLLFVIEDLDKALARGREQI